MAPATKLKATADSSYLESADSQIGKPELAIDDVCKRSSTSSTPAVNHWRIETLSVDSPVFATWAFARSNNLGQLLRTRSIARAALAIATFPSSSSPRESNASEKAVRSVDRSALSAAGSVKPEMSAKPLSVSRERLTYVRQTDR